ncbi:hypothetical protein [Streptomyces sp. NPDC093261]|uniref:hypothetical protein n=1 Tax=Streptomyces sp. NPDC093261 TaxID=3366037 RepID=UPI00381E1D13
MHGADSKGTRSYPVSTPVLRRAYIHPASYDRAPESCSSVRADGSGLLTTAQCFPTGQRAQRVDGVRRRDLIPKNGIHVAV